MNEPRKVIIGQDFQANQGCRQSCRISHLQAGRCRCMAQLAAIPRTANACAGRSAAGSTRRTRTITRRPMPSSPPTAGSAGSISAACRSLRSSARGSQLHIMGCHHWRSTLPCTIHRWTYCPTWRGRACRRRIRSTTQDAESLAFRLAAPTALHFANAGSPGRSATSSIRFSPPSRRAR